MKWGILATGTIAEKFAGTIRSMKEEGQSLQAVASRKEERAAEFAGRHGIPKCYGSYEALFADPDVEAVYIGTPNNLHYENCLGALEAGKHVLCEKPLTLTAKEAAGLYEIAEEKDLLLLEGLWIRFLPLYGRMQELLRSGAIGEIIWARSDYGFIAKGARRERKFRSELGGGALYDIGIYNIGFLQMVMGEDPSSFTSSQVKMNEFGTDSHSTLEFAYRSGRQAQCTQVIGEEIARNALITGTKGSIFLKDFQMAECMEITYEDGHSEQVTMPFEINGFEYEIRAFEKAVAEGSTCLEPYLPRESVANMSLLEEVRRSWGMEF